MSHLEQGGYAQVVGGHPRLEGKYCIVRTLQASLQRNPGAGVYVGFLDGDYAVYVNPKHLRSEAAIEVLARLYLVQKTV